MSARPWLALLAASLLAGGLRDPLAAAFGAAAAGLLAWRLGPLPLGPAVALLPWLAWTAFSCVPSPSPWAGAPVVARGGAFLVFLAAACRFDAAGRRAWLDAQAPLAAVAGAAALWTGWRVGGFGSNMWGLLPPYYNYTGLVLATAGAACAAAAMDPQREAASRRRFAAAAAFAAACLLLAKGRAALLGLAAACLWSAWRRWGRRAPAGAAVLALLALTAAPRSYRDRLLFKSGNYAGEARPGIWRRAVAMAADKPWHGAGPGQFGHAFRRDPVPARNSAARWGFGTPYAHSEPLHAAAETGLAGLALWLIGLGAVLRGALTRRPGPVESAARAALLAALPLLLLDNALHLTGLSFLFAAALALAGTRSEDEDPRLPKPFALAFAAVALASALPGVWARVPEGLEAPERVRAAARAAALFPGDAERHEDLAHAAEAAGDLPAAAAAWERAERLSPRNAVYSWKLGRALAAAGRGEEADAAFARAAESEPDFLAARADRAVLAAARGRRAEARALLEAVRREWETRPDRPAHSGYERTVKSFTREDLARLERALSAR